MLLMCLIMRKLQSVFLVCKPVPLLRAGGQGGVSPLATACASPFWLTQNIVFETSRNDKTTDNDGKRNNNVQTFFDVFSILCEIAGNQLLYIDLTQYSVLLTRFYVCVAEGHVSLRNRNQQYFVSDYDMKQYVKTSFFSKTSCFGF